MKQNLSLVAKSPWFWLIVTGYLIRIIVMPITGQHDVMFMPWMTRFINEGHYNLYEYLFETFGERVMTRPVVWAPYPYGFYLFTAGWLEFLETAGLIDLVSWESIWNVSYPARYVFLFKTPYLFFDLGIGYIIYRICGTKYLAIWSWSPVAIYTPFMMGQNDIYATAFAVAGTYAASKAIQFSNLNCGDDLLFSNKWALYSSIFLGIGACFKTYPLLLLPPLILILEKQLRKRLLLLCLSGAIYVGLSLPFLTTQTYIDGVLFNSEGMQIFRGFRIFGFIIPVFLVSYILFVGYLLIGRRKHNEYYQLAWFSSSFVLAILFLFVPSPLYWLIWITPFSIVIIPRSRKLFVSWLFLQISFVFILVSQHRELGVALPIHLADIFNVPNLPIVLNILSPFLYKIFIQVLTFVKGLQVFALLVIVFYAIWALLDKCTNKNRSINFKWMTLAGLPTLLMFSFLGINLLLSRNLVSHPKWAKWESQILGGSDHVLQELALTDKNITGVKLRFLESSPETVVELCVYNNGEINQKAVACDSKNVGEKVENQVLYFVFDKLILNELIQNPIVKISLSDSNSTITLPLAKSTNKELYVNGILIHGSLDISSLSRFSVADAYRNLITENIFKDVLLVVAIFINVVIILCFLLGMMMRFSDKVTEKHKIV